MIKGITITLHSASSTATDAFNRPIITSTDVSVPNVLVGEPSTDDITNALSLYGKKAVYKLAIPKGDANNWEGCKVTLPAPFAGVYQVIGCETAGIEENIPLKWNKKVLIERYG